LNKQNSILYLTDFYYPAKGREYYTEDLYLISKLKDDFEVLICHPTHSKNYEKLLDLVVFRNTGSVMYYKEYFDEFVKRVKSSSIITYNEMTGKGDMKGKQHLLDLTILNYPVIPTIEKLTDLKMLPTTEKYIIKRKDGADSIGMEVFDYHDLKKVSLKNQIIQPYIDFEYEVSFYYIDNKCKYALYAPNKTKRWDLKTYSPTNEDLIFADKFIEWNTINHGIQRVDACRLKNGDLLLVELEDLNPFLSIELLEQSERDSFVSDFKKSMVQVINKKKRNHGI